MAVHLTWLQVDFRAIAKITKLHLQPGGSMFSQHYVKKYRLLYTNDSRWWNDYGNNQGIHNVSGLVNALRWVRRLNGCVKKMQLYKV